MDNIRRATIEDASRIAEMIVTNYRINFYPIFKNEDFYFKELNVVDMAKDYCEHPEKMENCYVYDDGVVKGVVIACGKVIDKLYVEPQFQSSGIGAKLLNYAIDRTGAHELWALEYNTRGIAFYNRNGFELTGEKIMEDEWIPLLKLAKNVEYRDRD